MDKEVDFRDQEMETEDETIEVPCLYCGKLEKYKLGQGIFNAFCDKECEDRYVENNKIKMHIFKL